MGWLNHVFVFLHYLLLFAGSFGDITGQSEKYLKFVTDYFNNLPGQHYIYEDGVLVNAQKIDDNTHNVHINMKVRELHDRDKFKHVTCTGYIREFVTGELSIPENNIQCTEDIPLYAVPTTYQNNRETENMYDGESTTRAVEYPVKLENEVQPANSDISGEHFIAVPRETSTCFGCGSHVDPNAPGVQDLALLAIRHLDWHEPTARHTLTSVLDVERQVQVVNGVRFILTLNVNFDKCSTEENDQCRDAKICKVSILEKPWVRLSDGSKFRSIVSNNCTDQWLFGDDGEVLPTIPENSQENRDNNEITGNRADDGTQNTDGGDAHRSSSTSNYDGIANSGFMDDIVREVHKPDLQGQMTERTLTEQEMRDLELQIIPVQETVSYSAPAYENPVVSIPEGQPSTHRDVNSSPNHHSVIKIESYRTQNCFLSEERKRALDDLLRYFNGLPVLPFPLNQNYRAKRSVDEVAHVPLLMNKPTLINTEINNDLNEFLKSKYSSSIMPHISDLGGVQHQDPNDEKYRNLALQSLQKYHAQSDVPYVHKIVEIFEVTTQLVSGTITKINFKISPTACLTNETNKDSQRNCEVQDRSNIRRCQADVFDKPWRKIQELSVKCGRLRKDNPIEYNGHKRFHRTNGYYMPLKRWSRSKSLLGGVQNQDVNDERYRNLGNQSLQKYHSKSNVQYVHQIVEMVNVTTQVVSGKITKIDFKISPTKCLKSELSSNSYTNCKVQDSSNVRNCHSKIYESSDGTTEITVRCGDLTNETRQKKHGRVSENTSSKSDDILYVPLSVNDRKTNQKHGDVDILEPESTGSVRLSRSLLGGPQTKNPNNEKYINLAEESLKQYHENSDVQYVHKIVEVVKVSRQIVSGTITKLDFIISPTECIKNKTSALSRANCEIKDSSNVRRCQSKIYEKPWIQGNKEITVRCSRLKKDKRSRRNVDIKFKRHAEMTGAEYEQNPNENIYMKLALDSLEKYQLLSNTPYVHTILNIDRVTTQIVSGVLTKIDFQITPTHCLVNDLSSLDGNNCEIINPNVVLKCHSKVWDRPWLKDGKKIDVSCADSNISSNGRNKRRIIDFTGGIKDEDPTNRDYKNMAYESLLQYGSFSNNDFFHKITQIKNVTTQIVEGTLTHIDFTVVPTSCLKSEISSLEFNEADCAVSNTANQYDCQVEIWERSWLVDENEKKRIDLKCEPKNSSSSRKKRDFVVGGQKEQDPNAQQYKDLALRSLQKYQLSSSSQYAHKLITVDRVTTQLVAGTMTRINFTISPTSCTKNDVPGEVGENCEIRNETLKCFAQIWSRSWMPNENDKEEIAVNCAYNESELSRSKRSVIPGGVEQVDPNNDIYREIARQSLRQYQSFSNNENYHIITQMKNVTTQVVEGFITRIDFTIAPTNCLRNDADLSGFQEDNCEPQISADKYDCHVEVWDRPWLPEESEKKKIEINCILQENDVKKTKREVREGGLKEEDPTKQEYQNMAQRSLQKYQLLASSQAAHKLINVDSVSSQVVAGRLIRLYFTISPTSCSKSDVTDVVGSNCEVHSETLKCLAKIWSRPWLSDESEKEQIDVNCAERDRELSRSKRSSPGTMSDETYVYELVQESLRKIETTAVDPFKLRLVKINNFSTKMDRGRVITIDFDAAYTSCSKFETDREDSTCPFLESLPKRHCIADVRQKLAQNGRKIDVNCETENLSLHSNIDSENREVMNELSNIALKYVEAKYPHPQKQGIVRIIKWEKRLVADTHYRLKFEVGFTNCSVFSANKNCYITEDFGSNKLCRANIWVRPLSDHGPKIRIDCDHQDEGMRDLFLQIQVGYLFADFMEAFKPVYSNDTSETRRRFEIFKDNVKKIHAYNVYEKGTATYGVTRFADLTYEEFKKRHLGLNPSLQNPNQIPMSQARIPDVNLPASFDWREHGAVTGVKNQGSCGSCWAFSVTGNIEGQWKLKTGNLISLSEQELVDCDKLDDGCNGGLPDNAYRAIEQLGGLETEAQYPYEGENDKCVFNKSLSRVTVRGAVNITSNETGMAKWLLKNGPISIGINANAMQFYMGGISHPWKMLCDPNSLDHGVLIVGYGIKDYPLFKKRLPYWIVKNSWGPGWGEQGYYRVYRGDGTCGVNQMASSALV